MYNRLIADDLKGSSKSILLLGPRQVGKSTLLESLKPDLLINLSREDDFFSFHTNFLELESRINATKPRTVLIDEIQRAPRLLNSIQDIIDHNSKIKFFLSGSSARKLRKGRANLLPGRLLTYHLSPLSLLELDRDWDEKTSMQFGSLPGVIINNNLKERKKLLLSYSNTYLKEEIFSESLVRGLDGFVRFLHQAAVHSGLFLDISKISKKAKLPRQTTVRHFEILEDTIVAKKINNDPDIDEDCCDLIKHPRFFMFDLGVVNALKGSFELGPDRDGLLWEHLVFNQLLNTSHALDVDLKIYNFRTRGGYEVDFIVQNDSKKFALECKSSVSLDSTDFKNLKNISKYYSKITPILIYRGKVEKKTENIWALPLKKSLEVMGLSAN